MRILNRNERDNSYPMQTNMQALQSENMVNAMGSNSQTMASAVAPRNRMDGQVQLPGDRQVRMLNRNERDNFYPMQTNVQPVQSGNLVNAVGSNSQDISGFMSQVNPMEGWSVGHTPVVRFDDNLMSQRYN